MDNSSKKTIEEMKERGQWVDPPTEPPKGLEPIIPPIEDCESYLLVKQRAKIVPSNEVCLEDGWREPEEIFEDGFTVIEPIYINDMEDGRIAFRGKIKFDKKPSSKLILKDMLFEERNSFIQYPIETLKSSLLITNDGNMKIGINSIADLEVNLGTVIINI